VVAVTGHPWSPGWKAPADPYANLPHDHPSWHDPKWVSSACTKRSKKEPGAGQAELLDPVRPSDRGHRCVMVRCSCSCHGPAEGQSTAAGPQTGRCSITTCTRQHVTRPPVQEHPVYSWDPAGLPPRTEAERCALHGGMCAFRDDDPDRCPRCHRTWAKLATDTYPHACKVAAP